MTKENKDLEVPVQSSKKKTQMEELWNEIKGKKLIIFGLPNQTVANFCEPFFFSDKEMYLKTKAGAVLPALEDSLPELEFESSADGKFIIAKKRG